MRNLVLCYTRGEAQGWGHSHNTFWNAPTLGLYIVGMSPALGFCTTQTAFAAAISQHAIITSHSKEDYESA